MRVAAATRALGAVPNELDPRWHAVATRDSAADGTFYYSVTTTGVYCYPSCAARLANCKNVQFHETREAAERAGFRPCRRCKPDRERVRVAIGESSIGLVLVAHGNKGLTAVLLGDDRDTLRSDLQERLPGATLSDHGVARDALAAKVIAFVDSPARELDVPLDMRGSAFQREVWQALREIPLGNVASYSDVAVRIGRPNAGRAVAAACAANPLAVVVPCHRVVRRDGGLAGYRWGVDRKRALLEREGTA